MQVPPITWAVSVERKSVSAHGRSLNNSTPHKEPMYIFKPARELLPLNYYRALTDEAKRVYAGVWNKMSYKRRDTVTLLNRDMATRARIEESHLHDCQQELVRFGLLVIDFDVRPHVAFGELSTTYRFPVGDEQLRPTAHRG